METSKSKYCIYVYNLCGLESRIHCSSRFVISICNLLSIIIITCRIYIPKYVSLYCFLGPQIPSPKSRQNPKHPPPQSSPTAQHKYNLYPGMGQQNQNVSWKCFILDNCNNYCVFIGAEVPHSYSEACHLSTDAR